MIGIYKIENQLNHKVYIGQSVNIGKRWTAHRTKYYTEDYYDYPLYRAFRKYGIENFSFSVIQECSKEELNELEKYWINYYNSYNDGYNQTVGGESGGGPQKLTEEQVLDIYKRLKTNESMIKIGERYGVSHQTISDINLGYIWVHKNIVYPIRNKINKQYYCCDCGIEISKGAVRCKKCNNIIRQNRVITREELKRLIRTKPFTQIGAQFNVSDNAIRKWCKNYSLPTKRADIKKYTDEEWLSV